MVIREKLNRSYSLEINPKTGEITIRRKNYCCSKSVIEGLCSSCEKIYCDECKTWMTLDEYKGDFKARSNSCSKCRVTKKHTRSFTKKLRFSILSRDNFTCRYCGRSAPEVTLHVDHIKPFSEGGDNSSNNLVTACEDCNLGKSDILLETEQ